MDVSYSKSTSTRTFPKVALLQFLLLACSHVMLHGDIATGVNVDRLNGTRELRRFQSQIQSPMVQRYDPEYLTDSLDHTTIAGKRLRGASSTNHIVCVGAPSAYYGRYSTNRSNFETTEDSMAYERSDCQIPRDLSLISVPHINRSIDGQTGIPRYAVSVVNTCDDCSIQDIHIACGKWTSGIGVNPCKFRRITENDCLVNNGDPLPPNDIVQFDYTSSEEYKMSVKTGTPVC